MVSSRNAVSGMTKEGGRDVALDDGSVITLLAAGVSGWYRFVVILSRTGLDSERASL